MRVNKYVIKYSLPNYANGVVYTYITLQIKNEITPKSIFLTILQQIVDEVKEQYNVDITYNEINVEFLQLCDSYFTDKVFSKKSSQLNIMQGNNAKKTG